MIYRFSDYNNLLMGYGVDCRGGRYFYTSCVMYVQGGLVDIEPGVVRR